MTVGHLSALDNTLASIPVTFVIGSTARLSVDSSTRRLADSILRVPLAISRVSSTSSGVGTVAVAAAEGTLTRSIAEGAHARFSLAVNTRAHTRAGLLTSRLRRIPHAARVHEALGLVEERTILSTVGARSSGRSVGDRAERSSRALIRSSLGRNSSSDRLRAVIFTLFKSRVVITELVAVAIS